MDSFAVRGNSVDSRDIASDRCGTGGSGPGIDEDVRAWEVGIMGFRWLLARTETSLDEGREKTACNCAPGPDTSVHGRKRMIVVRGLKRTFAGIRADVPECKFDVDVGPYVLVGEAIESHKIRHEICKGGWWCK